MAYTLTRIGPAMLLAIVGHSVASAQFVEDDVDVLYTIEGAVANDQLGIELAAIADYNGDGVLEYLVAAWFYDTPEFLNAGRVQLIDGRSGAVMREYLGERENQFLRYVCDAGDVDADGVIDYMIGSGTDEVYIYSGADGELIREHVGVSGEAFGFRNCGLSDINGDGHGDVAIGAWSSDVGFSNAGALYVYSGIDGSLIRTHRGTQINDHFGHTTGNLGDIDGDGVNDYCVGAPGPYIPTRRGRSFLFSGATGDEIQPPLTPIGAGARNYGSWAPAIGMQHFNDDGIPDFVISDISDATGGPDVGRLYVYDGATRQTMYTLLGAGAWSGMGGQPQTPAGALGDVDGDGLSDLLVASWRSRAAAIEAGQVEILRGYDGCSLRTITSNVENAYFGNIISCIGDVDGNGTRDYVIGTPGHDGSRGIVYVINGHDHTTQPGDLTGDAHLDFSDVVAFLIAFGAQDEQADFAEPFGVINFLDVIVFLSVFGEGCP